MLEALSLVVHRAFFGWAAAAAGLGGVAGVTVAHAPLNRAQQRGVIRQVHLERLTLGRTFLCVRLPGSGQPVIMVMTTAASESIARRFLKEIHVKGSVEARTIGDYNDTNYRLSKKLQRAIPTAFRGVKIFQSIYNNGYTGRVTCPKVYIEVGLRHDVVDAVIRWAKSEVRRFGQDRLAWRYDLPIDPPGPP